jgi:hypothetical protein
LSGRSSQPAVAGLITLSLLERRQFPAEAAPYCSSEFFGKFCSFGVAFRMACNGGARIPGAVFMASARLKWFFGRMLICLQAPVTMSEERLDVVGLVAEASRFAEPVQEE